MPNRKLCLVLAFLALLSISTPPRSDAAAFQLSVIEGIVVGPDGRPVVRVIVRVFDESGFREAGRAQTNESGRFTVTVPSGRYILEADPVADPTLAKQRQEIEILGARGTSTSIGGERTNISFRLKASAVAAKPTGPRFDQQVPANAKAEYDHALKAFGSNREEALEALRKALQAFPEYYDALEMLGTEYVKDNHLDHALVILIKAIEVNPKGERSHYGLGVTYYKKGQFDLAVKAFKRALEISPNSANSLLYLGLSQLRSGHATDAEPSLKKAYENGATGVPELHMALYKVYADSSRYREAANQLKTMLKEIPDFKDAQKIKELIQKNERAAAQ
jgi:tetratricopeptide (TPR) repeat protein